MRIALVANAASGSFHDGLSPAAIRARLAAAGLDLAPDPIRTCPCPNA